MNEIRNPVSAITVGLDMSLTGTGFCLKAGTKLDACTISTTPRTAENDIARLRWIANEMMKRIPTNVSLICMEDVFMPHSPMQMGSACKLFMLAAVMRMTLYEKGLPFFIVAPTQIKKWVTGSGAGQKSTIMMNVFKKYGVECKDDNQADSLVLSVIAESIVQPRDDLTKPQQEVLKAVLADRPRYNWPKTQ